MDVELLGRGGHPIVQVALRLALTAVVFCVMCLPASGVDGAPSEYSRRLFSSPLALGVIHAAARPYHDGQPGEAEPLTEPTRSLPSGSAEEARPVRVPPWPCRLVVKPPLAGAIEAAWQRSPTLQHQCRELAGAGAVVILEWGGTDSQSRARARIAVAADGVIVAHVSVPPVSEAIELVAHELEHVIEKAHGVNVETESKRRGSGVWRAYGGFETQRAIDAGRQVAQELRESGHSR